MEENYNVLIKQIKNNIIDWYPFQKEESVLEIVTKKEDMIDIEEKVSKLDKIVNLENLTKITEDSKYNYILIIGSIIELEKHFEKLLKNIAEDGKFLIITDNALAIKNACQENINKSNLYNYREIKEFLNRYGLNNYKFYYALPDYKTVNVIFTDKKTPDKENISRNIIFYNAENNVVMNKENNLYLEIMKQDKELFKIFANSFFIEASKQEFKDNEISFVSFSNLRKEEYRIKTIIQGEKVYKTYSNSKAKDHIKQIKNNIDIMKKIDLNTIDSYDEERIISEYQKDINTLDKVIVEQIENGKENEAKELIIKLYNELKEKLQIIEEPENIFKKYNISYGNENIENLNFVKYGLWDLIFQNAFYINDRIYFYDQEWIEENIPVEYILYRAIKYCRGLQQLLDINEIYNELNIKESNIEIFEKLDDVLQRNIRSEIAWELHARRNLLQELKEQKEQLYQESLKLLNEKDARIKYLEDNMEQTVNIVREKETEIAEMEKSIPGKVYRAWKKIIPKKENENEAKR